MKFFHTVRRTILTSGFLVLVDDCAEEMVIERNALVNVFAQQSYRLSGEANLHDYLAEAAQLVVDHDVVRVAAEKDAYVVSVQLREGNRVNSQVHVRAFLDLVEGRIVRYVLLLAFRGGAAHQTACIRKSSGFGMKT